MMRILIGIFFILHGLVHALYTSQSLRLFELQPGMVWPERSWLLSRFADSQTLRIIGGISLAVVALTFIVGGTGLLAKQGWFKPITLAACALSTLLYLAYWDGTLQHLDNQGGIGILINIAVATSLLMNWPELNL
ncbi:MAG: hypothetical protein PVF85_03770 [Anaerolineales bacterium]|jgi:hypothetical protein